MSTRAGCRFHQTRATGLDLAARTVACADGTLDPFDWLSIDTGPTSATVAIEGAPSFALPVRPIEAFILGIEGLLETIANGTEAPIAIIGAGAAGVELAFALRHRCPDTPISVIGSSAMPLEGLPGRLQRHASALMHARNIAWRNNFV